MVRRRSPGRQGRLLQLPLLAGLRTAQSHDPHVVPMLLAILRDEQGKVDASADRHPLHVEWPWTDVILWGAFGSKGTPGVRRVLAESKSESARASAIVLLTPAQDIEAIEPIRHLAVHGSGAVRDEAVKALGIFGCPAGLRFPGGRPEEPRSGRRLPRTFTSRRLGAGDLRRGAPFLAALLSTDNERLGEEVVASLAHF